MKKNNHFKFQPKRILVISMRYLGDVLLTTPLVHSLRQAYPGSQLDILVYHNTAAILEGNPDINHVICISQRPSLSETLRLFRKLFRNYDLAVVTQTGDRPFIYSLLSARTRVAAVPPQKCRGWWKRFFMQFWVEFDDVHTHTVLQHLKLTELIGVPSHFILVPPKTSDNISTLPFLPFGFNYAVLHIHPQWTYKRWTEQGWVTVSRYLESQGLRVVLSGSPAREEMDYLAQVQRQLPSTTINIAGKVSFAQLTGVVARARLFIGPDTGITHLAAATGTPVIALYGPTNPVKWAPWPFNYQQNTNPFQKKGNQNVNNVFLIQGEADADCVPCHQEGCARHRQSHSDCLDTLPSEKVIKTIQRILSQ